MERPPLISDPDKVTAEWLTSVLRSSGAVAQDTEIGSLTARDVGTGQVGCNVRFTLEYRSGTGPSTIVGKFASRDEASRNAGIQTKTYETEVSFYRDLADTVRIRRPQCYFAEVVPGTAETALVFEDLAPAVQGDQITGCSVEHAQRVVVEAARLHAPRWGDPTLTDLEWLRGRTGVGASSGFFGMLWRGFAERYDGMLSEEAKALGGRMSERFEGYGAGSVAPPTVVHGDYRLDNMLFGTDQGGYPVAVVDWQTVALGVGTSDVAYFLGAGLTIPDRREHERDLVELYHRTLEQEGVSDYPLEECWLDYRRFTFSGFLMAVFASMIVGRTDRGDQMFMAMANRHAAQVADLDSEALLG